MIPDDFKQKMPPSVKPALEKLPQDQQLSFMDEYNRRVKSLTVGVILTLLLPGLHFYQMGFSFGRIVLSLLFWSTCGGFFIWWLLEFFLHRKRIQRYNEILAIEIMKDVKILNA